MSTSSDRLRRLQQIVESDEPMDRLGRLQQITQSGGAPAAREPSGLSGGLRTAAQGATLGFGDELEALARGAGALVPGGRSPREAFGAGLEEARGDIEQFREEHPVLAPALEIGGGLATGGAGLLRSGARVGAKTVGRGLLKRLAGTQAARGAAEGAIAGAGAAEGGIPQRLAGAAVGGTIGAATGGVLGGAGALTRPAGQRAARAVESAMGRQGAPDIAGAVSRLRPGETIMDIAEETPGASTRRRLLGARGGTPIQRLARGAESLGGEGGEEIRQFLTERSARAADDVTEALSRHSGLTFENAVQTAEDMVRRQAERAAPLYDEARKHGVPLEGELAAALKLPRFQEAYERGRRIAAVQDIELPDIKTFMRQADESAASATRQLSDMGFTAEQIARMDIPTGAAFEGEIPIQAIDYMKRGLNDLISSRPEGLGSEEARVLNERLNRVLRSVDERVPEYKAARAAFAGDAAVREAFDAGREGSPALGLKRFTQEDPRVIARALQDMTPSEQELYRRGAFDDVREIIEGSADNRDLTKRLFGNETMRKRLRLLFPDEGEFQQFEDEMVRLRRQAGTEQFVLGGSPTARIQAEQRALEGGAPEILGGVAQVGISPQWAAMGLARRGAAALGQRGGRRTSAELAPMLTATSESAPAVGRMLQDLTNQMARRDRLLGVARRGLVTEPGLEAGRAVSR